jgi:hypothetical protein
MALMGLPIGRIDAILLTHFHSDHIGGLGEMMLVRWASTGNSEPVEVFGPPGVESVVEGFNRAYELDKGYRVAHHGAEIVPPSGAGGTARPFALPEGEDGRRTILEEDGVRITAFSVDHSPVHPAVGYRFDYKGRSVLISGDTVQSRNLTEVARGADLLVHEGLQAKLVGMIHEAAVKHGQRNIAKITKDIPGYHTTPEEAAKIASDTLAVLTATTAALMIVAQIAQNRILMRLFHSIADELRVQRGVLILSHMGKEDLLRELREHAEILACIKRRDGERAAELLTVHLKTAMRILTEARARKGQGQEIPAEKNA